jgi:hypothetical protein
LRCGQAATSLSIFFAGFLAAEALISIRRGFISSGISFLSVLWVGMRRADAGLWPYEGDMATVRV